MNPQGATALITGGASGLGAASATQLSKEGANVVLVDLNEDKGNALAAQLGARAAFIRADVANPEQVQAAVEFAVGRFGKIDILVNCAGVGLSLRTVSKDGPHPLDRFRRVIEINLIGTFDMIRNVAFRMAANEPNEYGERGVIVNTASGAAYEPQVGQAAYSASKAGLVGMTIAIARDLGSLGIRVCTIAPGAFDTPLFGRHSEEMKAGLVSHAAFPRRLGNPAEYGELVSHIVHNRMLNAETIRLDGGLRMPAK